MQYAARIQRMNSPKLSLSEACRAITDGRLLIYPTETFYALGCNAFDVEAVRGVYAVKQRGCGQPLPVIIGVPEQLALLTAGVNSLEAELMRVFWPGPLSILFAGAAGVPELLTAGTGRVAVRFSSHPAAAELCGQSSRVLVSSSANLSGRGSVRLAADLDRELLDRVREFNRGTACVYAAGRDVPQGGLPSTIVEAREAAGGGVLRVLRQGAVSLEELRAGIPPGMEIQGLI
jgi:L-threonylcarbamoyladenylate synthase